MKKYLLLLTTLFILVFPLSAQAQTTSEVGAHNDNSTVLVQSGTPSVLPQEGIEPVVGPTGNFKSLIWEMKSAFGTGGIRYHTVAVWLEVPSDTGQAYHIEIPVQNLFLDWDAQMEACPDFSYGTQYSSELTVTRAALLANVSAADQERVGRLLDRASYYSVGAVIQIVNSNTGAVLKTMSTKDEVLGQTIMPTYIPEMLTRFRDIKPAPNNIDYVMDKQTDLDPAAWNATGYFDPGIYIDDKVYAPGDVVTLKCRVNNAWWSKIAAPKATDLRLLYWNSAGTAIADPNTVQPVPILNPQEFADHTFTYTVPNLSTVPASAMINGYIRLSAVVNSNTDFAETNTNATGGNCPDNDSITFNIKISEPPDFYPSVPSLTYSGIPGSTITIPALVFNQGGSDTTDFVAAWNGAGWTNPLYHQSGLTIAKGASVNVPFAVTVPATATKLWLKVNSDGKTPVSEVEQSNNVISVTVGPNTADVGVSISLNTTSPTEYNPVVVTVSATNYGPASADIKLQTGENSGSGQTISSIFGSETFTLASGASKSFTYNSGGYAAGYSTYFATQATVTNTTDPNLANNFARSSRVTWQAFVSPIAPLPVLDTSKNKSSLIH